MLFLSMFFFSYEFWTVDCRCGKGSWILCNSMFKTRQGWKLILSWACYPDLKGASRILWTNKPPMVVNFIKIESAKPEEPICLFNWIPAPPLELKVYGNQLFLEYFSSHLLSINWFSCNLGQINKFQMQCTEFCQNRTTTRGPSPVVSTTTRNQ